MVLGTTLRAWLRVEAQRAYLRLRPFVESVGEIRAGDPGAAVFASFGAGSRIAHPYVALTNPHTMAVGVDTYIRSHVIVEAYAAPGNVVIRVGDGVQLGHGVRLVAFNGIDIEDLVGIGHGCTIADSVHDWKNVREDEGRALWDTPPKTGRTLHIGRGAWLGNNCVVTGGITIGAWAVVEPNTVLTKDVPPHTIVGGNPTRVLRARMNDGSWKAIEERPLLQDYAASSPVGTAGAS